MDEKMYKAYKAAKEIIDEQTTEEEAQLLQDISNSDVVIVRGCYDRVEDVMQLLQIPHDIAEPESVGRLKLAPKQMLIINCPGNLGRNGITNVRNFVEQGGTLFTTDWALKHVLEQAFPGFVAYNNRPTGDEVVRIEIKDTQSKLFSEVFHEGEDPLWWLEGSSYPIKILDSEKVQVLLTSEELKNRYGEPAVAVTFKCGNGEVYHMISHYYLQRAETRTGRHKSSWKDYASEVGSLNVAEAALPEFEDLNVGEVEAAHKSARFMRFLVLEKQRKNRGERR